MQTGDFLTADGAEKYYDRDNYYLESEGYWYGKLAEKLNLSPGSTLQKEEFSNMLRGRAPNGDDLMENAGQKNRCPGCDLTFSAPKSVSLLSFKDERIGPAFYAAVHKTLDYAEQNLIQTRRKKKGVISYEKTDNAAFAIFGHQTSRELDPQLHAHCVMFNMTVDKRGKFMSIHNTLYQNHKLLIGQYFRNELALEMQKLGYQIYFPEQKELKGKGFFEVQGVTREIIDDFSKRREQIKEEIERLRQIEYKDLPPKHIEKWAAERIPWRLAKEVKDSDLEKFAAKRIAERYCSNQSHPVNYPELLQNEVKALRESKEIEGKHWALSEDWITMCRSRPDYPALLKKEISAIETSNEKVYDTEKWDDAKLAVLATKNSRIPKKNVKPEHIVELIDNTLAGRGMTLDGLVAKAQAEKPPARMNVKTPTEAILAVVESAIQTEVAFTKAAVIKDAMKLTMGMSSPAEIVSEFDRLIKTGKLTPLRKVMMKGLLPEEGYIYTTPELKALETENIELCRLSKTSIQIDPQITEDFIAETDRDLIGKNGFGLTAGQKNGLRQIVKTENQFSGIQGDAGTGKSFSMLYAKELLEKHGYNVRGLAPTGKAADELHSAAEIADTATLHKIIQNPEAYNLERGKEVFIVDESSMGGSRTINKLLKLAKEYDAKVVFVGDRKQFASVDAGRFFIDLQERAKVDITIMEDVIRQKTEQTKGIVKAISSKKFDAAIVQLSGFAPAKIDKSRVEEYQVGQMLTFDRSLPEIPGNRPEGGSAQITAVGERSLTIKYKAYGRDIEMEIDPKTAHSAYTVYTPSETYTNCIKVIRNDEARLQAVADDYVNCYNAGKDVMVITATNDDRRRLNAITRQALVSLSKVEDVGEFTLQEPTNISKFIFASSFKTGQLIKGLPQLKVDNKYEHGEIIDIDQRQNRLKIRNVKTNEEFMIDPADYVRKPFSVFSKSTMTLGINERITFLKNAKLTGSDGKPVNVRNGQLGTITALDNEGNITVKRGKGKDVKFNLNDYNLLTTAYALSSHKSQGMTVDKIIWHADTYKDISANSFYVAVTRCKYDVAVYTNDAERLQKKVKKEQEKYSTLDDYDNDDLEQEYRQQRVQKRQQDFYVGLDSYRPKDYIDFAEVEDNRVMDIFYSEDTQLDYSYADIFTAGRRERMVNEIPNIVKRFAALDIKPDECNSTAKLYEIARKCSAPLTAKQKDAINRMDEVSASDKATWGVRNTRVLEMTGDMAKKGYTDEDMTKAIDLIRKAPEYQKEYTVPEKNVDNGWGLV